MIRQTIVLMFLLNGTKKFIIKDKIPKKIKPNNPASLVLIFLYLKILINGGQKQLKILMI